MQIRTSSTASPPAPDQGRDQRVQRQTAQRREEQQSAQAARDQGRADFERALARAQGGERPAPKGAAQAQGGRPHHAADAHSTARRHGSGDKQSSDTQAGARSALDPRVLAHGGGVERTVEKAIPTFADSPAFALPSTGSLATTGATSAPSAGSAGEADAPAAVEALSAAAATDIATLAAPAAAPFFSATPAQPPSPAMTPEMLGHHLQRLQLPVGDESGRWRFELADPSLPVQRIDLARGAEGGLQLTLGGPSASTDGAPLQRLRERLAERGTPVASVHWQGALDAVDGDSGERA